MQKKVECFVGLCPGHHPEYISRKTYKEACKIIMERAKHCRMEKVQHMATMKKFVPCIANSHIPHFGTEKLTIWKSDELL